MKIRNCLYLALVGGVLLIAISCGKEDPVPRRIVYQESEPGAAEAAAAESAAAMGPFGIALAQRTPPPEVTLEQSTIRALGNIGAPSVPALIEMLADPDPLLRRDAAHVLAQMGGDARPAIPQLTLALEDADTEVRIFATRALGSIGGAARDAVPALINELRQQAKSAAAESERQASQAAKTPAASGGKLPTGTKFPSTTVPIEQ